MQPDQITDAEFQVVEEPMVHSRGIPIMPKGLATFLGGTLIFSAFYGAWHATNRMENILAVCLALYGVYFPRFMAWVQKPVPEREMIAFWAKYQATRQCGRPSALVRTD